MISIFIDILANVEAAVILFGLVCVRLSVLVQLLPFLGGKATPQSVKIAVAMALSLVVLPSVWPAYQAAPPSDFMLALLAVKEAMIGLTLGFVTALVFDAMRVAGQIIDTARGQNLATALVPQLPDRVSLSAVLLYQIAVVVFLIAGGHLLFYRAILGSFTTFPLLAFPQINSGEWMMWITRWFGDSMAFSLQIAVPTVTAILLADLVLALVNKAAPQIQVFFLGMPAKAMLGILVLALSLSIAVEDFWLGYAMAEMEHLADQLQAAP